MLTPRPRTSPGGTRSSSDRRSSRTAARYAARWSSGRMRPRCGSTSRPRWIGGSSRRRRERLLPAAHPGAPPAARGRARRGVQPGARGRDARGWQGPAEPLVIRPTSETVFGEFMAKWIQSYRDLPLLLTSGPTSFAGSCGHGSSFARASSSGRKATRPTRRNPMPPASPARSTTTSTRRSCATAWRCRYWAGSRHGRSGSPARRTRSPAN